MSGGVRITGCLTREQADRLWLDLAAYRKAARLPYRIERRKYGRGYALWDLSETLPGYAAGHGL